MSLIFHHKHRYGTSGNMAELIPGRINDIRKELVREAFELFDCREHRLEYVASANDVDYINDSISTNINSTWYSLETMKAPVIWIAGGQDKGNDYTDLLELARTKVKAIVCLAKDSYRIRKAFASVVDTIIDAGSADQAVRISYRLARPGDTVLLSPACASFDLFEDYQDRGRQFKAEVRKL